MLARALRRLNALGPSTRFGDSRAAVGYAIALVAAMLFSTKSVVIKLAYAAGSDAEALLALRMCIALPVYIIIWLSQQKLKRAPSISTGSVALAASIGVFGYALSSYLDLKGLEFISAPIERLILFTYPFFVAIFGALFFGTRISRAAIVGLVISYAGLIVVLLDSLGGPALRVELAGVVLVFASAATFALYQLWAGRAVRAIGAVQFTCISMAAAAGASILLFIAHRPAMALVPSQRVFWLASLLAIAGTVLPSFALSEALKRISAQANSAIGSVSPVLTTALCVWFLGDTVSVRSAVGGMLVLAGAVWFTTQDR